MTDNRTKLGIISGILLTTVAAFAPAQAADVVLSGTISSAAGQKLEGATVSAKREGTTITTSVYTDESGNYYFLLWRRASTISGRRRSGSRHQEHSRSCRDEEGKHDAGAMTDPERRIRQLPAELLVAALPEDTSEDARIKKVFTNQCTGCHNPGYVLQFRFDEEGWNKVIGLMARVRRCSTIRTPRPIR